MIVWLDANISPAIAEFISVTFQIPCYHIDNLDVDITDDEAIFLKAKKEDNIIVTTKDYDFVQLQERLGAPPKIIWLTCGNTSNFILKQKLTMHFAEALKYLQEADIVEIA